MKSKKGRTCCRSCVATGNGQRSTYNGQQYVAQISQVPVDGHHNVGNLVGMIG